MSDIVDITNLDKAAVLVALVNAASPLGGLPQAGLTSEGATRILQGRTSATPYTGQPQSVDYVNGRPIKVNLGGNSFDPKQYDSNHGQGAAARAVEALNRPVTDVAPSVYGPNGPADLFWPEDGSPPYYPE